MIALSKAAMCGIHADIALGLKAVFLAITILGIKSLGPAILAHMGATFLVTASLMRLLG